MMDQLTHVNFVELDLAKTVPDNVPTSDDYSHLPLDTTKHHIRLVKLHRPSAPKHANVFCEFATFEIESAPPYVALSYTWGAPSPTRIIFMNHQCFEVRENLFDFLCEFQNDEANICYLWIDQLCIDQSNPHERNHQVRLMSSIYQRCLYVIVWLDRSSYAAALLLDEVTHEEFNYTAAFLPAESLLTNRYFNRLWIVQEVLLPRQVHILCGDVWLSWSDLRNLIWNHPKWFLATNRSINHTSVAWLFGSTGGDPSRPSLWEQDRIPLGRCMTLFAQMECADPRDKVYGILGLVSEEDRPPVDYQKALIEVTLDVIMALCRVHWRSAVDSGTEEECLYRVGVFLRIAGSLELRRNRDFSLHMFLEELCEIESWALTTQGVPYDSSPITSVGSDKQSRNVLKSQLEVMVEPGYLVGYLEEYRYWYEVQGRRYYRDMGTAMVRYNAKSREERANVYGRSCI